jgi:hypothetical protein
VTFACAFLLRLELPEPLRAPRDVAQLLSTEAVTA